MSSMLLEQSVRWATGVGEVPTVAFGAVAPFRLRGAPFFAIFIFILSFKSNVFI